MNEELIERVAELQLAAFLAGRGSVTGMKNGTRVAKPAPSMDDFRRMAQSAIAAMQPHIAAEREDAARRALEWMRPQVEEMLFLKYWRQDGMNTEQARIHAKARTDEGLAAAPIAQFREAGNG